MVRPSLPQHPQRRTEARGRRGRPRGTFRHHDERFALSPPIDWWDEPYRGANERGFFQNSFVFADPLLADPRFEEVLVPLAEIFADWLSANPRDGPAAPAPLRLARSRGGGACRRDGFRAARGHSPRRARPRNNPHAASGVLEHIRYLLADENYAAHNNHGFASDAAIAIAARSLAPAPEVGEWSRYRRTTLRGRARPHDRSRRGAPSRALSLLPLDHPRRPGADSPKGGCSRVWTWRS